MALLPEVGEHLRCLLRRWQVRAPVDEEAEHVRMVLAGRDGRPGTTLFVPRRGSKLELLYECCRGPMGVYMLELAPKL
jgi:hypothetical protein